MPKDRSRTLNPAAAHLKSEKARSIKKSRAAVTAQRTERLATRNPSRLERQIADLEASAGAGAGGDEGLKGRDKKQLEELQRQLSAVRKAREKIGGEGKGGGGEGRGRGRGGGGGGGASVLGKRGRGEEGGGYERKQRDEEEASATSDETDQSVRAIPMPRDTPPPVPFSRRHHTSGRRRDGPTGDHDRGRTGNNANLEPLGKGRGGERVVHGLPPTPEAGGGPARVTVAKTTYEAKPIVRDLRKEAVRAFMPAVVARKVGAARGEGGAGGRLLEEEEVEKLETEGYAPHGVGQVRKGVEEGKGVEDERGEMGSVDAAPAVMEADRGGTAEEDEEQRRLKEEEERFSREVRMDEVSDEDL